MRNCNEINLCERLNYCLPHHPPKLFPLNFSTGFVAVWLADLFAVHGVGLAWLGLTWLVATLGLGQSVSTACGGLGQ